MGMPWECLGYALGMPWECFDLGNGNANRNIHVMSSCDKNYLGHKSKKMSL